ncbi:MAG: 6-bladed beta-propeller [Acidobacteriota bacterium]|nr:6-bladed beta-propeller [Acidobacteriota bacterium]
MFSLLLILYFSADIHKVVIQPFPFEDEQNPETFIQKLRQVDAAGGLIYIRDRMDPRILVINRRGKFVRRIGRPGPGPGELGRQSISIGVRDYGLWAVHGNMNSLLYYENGELLHRFRIQNYNRQGGLHRNPKTLAFTRDAVVIPVEADYQVMAAVYGYDGEVKRFIPTAFSDQQLYRQNPAVNDAYWAEADETWYCLFKYQPLLMVFDRNFQVIAQHQLEGEEIDLHVEQYRNHRRKNKFDIPPPLFYDFKVFNGMVYTLCRGMLYRINPRTGKTLSRAGFFGKGPRFKTIPGRLWLYYFAFPDEDTVLLGAVNDSWSHWLWQADTPFSKR